MHIPRSTVALALVLAASAARAGLGGHIADVATDAALLHARAFSVRPQVRSTNGPAFTRQQIALPTGGSAEEFVDAGGNVFAVSWAAPIMPDLTVLLGNYKDSLDAAQQAPGTVRSPRVLRADNGDWVLVSTGHLRAYQGYSYLRSRLPAGFDLTELTQ